MPQPIPELEAAIMFLIIMGPVTLAGLIYYIVKRRKK